MQNQWLADDAYVAFAKMLPTFSSQQNLNEANTRLRIIDDILFDVLRWDKLEVDAEKYVRTAGFVDYVFGKSGGFSLVIEAKREGIYFVLPNREYPPKPVSFKLLAKECPEAADALRQALGYAVQLGAQYVCITNGYQWILGLTFVQHTEVEDRQVIVFESLTAIDTRFREFFECFSPYAIKTNLPYIRLLDARRAPAPPKLSTQIPGYPVPAERNLLLNTMKHVLGLIWDEVEADPDNEIFLRECYISPEPSMDMLRVAKELLLQRRTTDAHLAAEPEHADAKKLLATKDLPERPIVLLGRIGHGKSMFLRYLRNIEAKDILQSKYIQIDLNFLDRPADADGVYDFIINEVERQLKDVFNLAIDSDVMVRQALKQELKDFRSSPRGQLLANKPEELGLAEVEYIETFTKDRNKYLARLMRLLRRGHNKSVVIFFDNLDRQDDVLQEKAFLRASAMATEWSALVFVCLRPGTMQRSQARGVLDTIAPRLWVISHPKTVNVLRKRFQYAGKFVQRKLPDEAYTRAPFSSDIQNSLLTAAKFFDMCDKSLLKNPGVANQYEAVANGNMRAVIGYVRGMLTSDHLNTHKIVRILTETGEYTLAEHETLRAMMFGPFIHYDPNTSIFVNLFDIRRADPTEHFSRLLLLDYCHRHANSVDRYGFISISTLHSYMTSVGYTVDHVQDVIDVLFSKKCLESRDYDEDVPEMGDELRITSLGSYHITTLVRGFTYLDAVVVDTPVLDDKTRQEIKDVDNILGRFERARALLRYLDRCIDSVQDVEARRVWTDISTSLVNNVTDIENDVRAKMTTPHKP